MDSWMLAISAGSWVPKIAFAAEERLVASVAAPCGQIDFAAILVEREKS